MTNEEGDVPRKSKRRHIWVLRIAGAILLALVALLVLVPPLRDAAVDLFSRPTAAAIAPAVASEITATADAQAWSTLQQHPLRLPTVIPGTTCPVSPVHSIYYAGSVPGMALGSSPIYVVGGGSGAIIRFADAHTFGTDQSAWGGQKVLWVIAPTYGGPVLIRGQRIDGSGEMRFNGGVDQQSYPGDLATAPLLYGLRLVSESDGGISWTHWPSYTRIQTAGCYAYQVDGLTFREVIVFQAVFS